MLVSLNVWWGYLAKLTPAVAAAVVGCFGGIKGFIAISQESMKRQGCFLEQVNDSCHKRSRATLQIIQYAIA